MALQPMFPDPFGIDKFFERAGSLRRSADIRARCAAQRNELVEIPFWDRIVRQLDSIPFAAIQDIERSYGNVVTMRGSWPSAGEAPRFESLLRELMPWRKGPFSLMGIEVDTEWRSNLKWDRIEPALPKMDGAVIADIGCNNGYYMFRMIPYSPRAILGIDPNGRFFRQFQLLHRLFKPEQLFFEPLGVEDAPLFYESFDIVLCLGVIYHRRDPMQMLLDIKDALKSGGTAVFESITIPGKEGDCLTPPGRYAMMRNVWTVPSPATFSSWIARAGFTEVRIVDISKTEVTEQRKTDFARFDSLSDFLDPADDSKTVEGHPAPERTIISAKKP